MGLVVWASAAVTAAFILLTVAQTREAYPNLPQRVPIHFDFAGRPNAYGPRPMIWMLVGVQLLCAAMFGLSGYAIAAQMPGTHGSLAGLALVAPIVTAMLWRAQMLLLDVAPASEHRVSMGAFWLFYAAGLATILAIVVFIR